jgi:serine/threonine protein phosphatase PrpC
LQVEYADLSLLGGRGVIKKKIAVAVAENAALLVVVDGMGGHAEGARAAEVTLKTLLEAFWHTPQPLFDPLGFLHLTLGKAHEEVVRIGLHLPMESRPRATCAVCLVQQGSAYWAHVGDSRIYLLRHGAVAMRTRDHSHVEVLLREGLITPDQAHNHPLRNYVECCLGGDPVLPDMALGQRRGLQSDDVLFVCTDGVWGGLRDADIAAGLTAAGIPARDQLAALCRNAIAAMGANSDNTSGAVLRWRSQ